MLGYCVDMTTTEQDKFCLSLARLPLGVRADCCKGLHVPYNGLLPRLAKIGYLHKSIQLGYFTPYYLNNINIISQVVTVSSQAARNQSFGAEVFFYHHAALSFLKKLISFVTQRCSTKALLLFHRTKTQHCQGDYQLESTWIPWHSNHEHFSSCRLQ